MYFPSYFPEIWANIAVCIPLVYMSPQKLQTNKPNNLIRRKSPFSLLWKGRGQEMCCQKGWGRSLGITGGCYSTQPSEQGLSGREKGSGAAGREPKHTEHLLCWQVKGQHSNQKYWGRSLAAILLLREMSLLRKQTSWKYSCRCVPGKAGEPYHGKGALQEVCTSTAISLLFSHLSTVGPS